MVSGEQCCFWLLVQGAQLALAQQRAMPVNWNQCCCWGSISLQKWKVEKVIEPQLPSCLCPDPWHSACEWLWGRSWEHRMWGNGPISASFGSACDLRNSAPFKDLIGSSPAGKTNSEKQLNSADIGICKDPGRTVLHLVYASLFCTLNLYNVQSFLGLPGRIFASKRKSKQLSSQTVSGCLFLLTNEVTHF